MKKLVLSLSVLILGLFLIGPKVFAEEDSDADVELKTSLLYITFIDTEGMPISFAPNQSISLSESDDPYAVTAPELPGYTFSGATYYKDQLTINGQAINLPFTVQYQEPPEGYHTHIQWIQLSYTPAQKSVYRLYHPGLQVHLYTTDWNEYNVLQSRGWRNEGTAWTTETEQGEEVYRLYHPDLRVHLYTKDANEYKVLAERGWKQEGVAYRSYGEVPIYRLYNAGLKKHLYTKDANEYKVLAERGWKQEGIAWYSQP